MKITDIIRTVLDIVDSAEQPQVEQPKVAAVVTAKTDIENELMRMRQIAGLVSDDETEYSNTPQERIAPVDAVIVSGDDVHKSKNPADIRTNAPSMYPGFQAGVK